MALHVCAASEPDNVLVIGEQTRVAILIDEPLGVGAFGLVLIYDTAKVVYSRVDKSGATDHYIIVSGAENVLGEVTIGGFGTPPISVSTPDTLCYVVFDEIINDPNPRTSCLSLQTTNFIDDIESSPDCYSNRCLTPAEDTTWGRIKSLWSN
jgi:hypothetical protein